MISSIFISTIVFLFVWVAMAIIPFVTRKTENFGVSIPESYYDRQDFKTMRKQYTSITLGIGLLFFVILLNYDFLSHQNNSTLLFPILIITYLILSFVIYLPFHFKMKKLKSAEAWDEKYEQKTIIDLSFRHEKLTYSNWYFVFSGLLWLISVSILIIFHQSLSDKIPVHIGLDGVITYQETSLKVFLLLPSIQLFLLLLFLGINVMIKRTKQQIHADNPGESRQQNIIYRRRWSAFTIITGTALQFIFLFQQIALVYEPFLPYINWTVLIITIGIILAVFIIVITTGQGGSRVNLRSDKNKHYIDRDQDKYWKLGQFYVNRNDPSIFIEKRFGVGWTNNWAHPVSWLLILLLLGICGIFIWMTV